MTTTDLRERISVLGSGMLHDAISTALGDAVGTLVVVATDTWDASSYPDVRQRCRDQGVPWLPVRAELGGVVIGPVELPDTAGCGCCFELRRDRARANSEGYRLVLDEHATRLAEQPSSWLTVLGSDTVSALVADEVRRLATDSARTRNTALYVDLEQLTVTAHRFLPDPWCPECGALPADAPSEITLAARSKPDPLTFRTRALADEFDALTDLYVDEHTGLLRTLHQGGHNGLAVATAELPRRSTRRITIGTGRARNRRDSDLFALLDGLKHSAGLEPTGARTVVEGRYVDLPGPALDPSCLGTHPEENYWIPGFGCRMFFEDQISRWVWGYSFTRQEPVLVPETVAYHGIPERTAVDRPFVAESSTGCAVGSSIEEAVVHGLLDVAKQDACLLTWHARMPAPRLDPRTTHDRDLSPRVASISAETGYGVHAFDTTVETGIPCVWALAVAADDGTERPKAVSATGAHPTWEGALRDALDDLGHALTELMPRFPGDAERARRMAHDSRLVTTRIDHALLHGSSDGFNRLRFLVESPNQRELPVEDASFTHTDLREDLREMLRRHTERGMDVVVVDQTGPELRAGGLHCVKVLIPGTLPRTFGHAYRRLEGLPRLYEVPHLLGHTDRPLEAGQINALPHPFL